MNNIKPKPIEFTHISLSKCSVEEYCLALKELKTMPFWWHLCKNKIWGNFSLPYKSFDGDWWYMVKPGFSWTVDAYKVLEYKPNIPFKKSFIGFQYMVKNKIKGNCNLIINTIPDLYTYRPSHNERKKIKKGKRLYYVESISLDKETLMGCLNAWNNLRERTGWRTNLSSKNFFQEFRELKKMPGTSIFVARTKDLGKVAGFLIVKCLDDTAYGDTIAVDNANLKKYVNDILIYNFLMNVKGLNGIQRVHWGIKSNLKFLEEFKRHVGFEPIAYPAYIKLNQPFKLGLKLLRPATYKRMIGVFD